MGEGPLQLRGIPGVEPGSDVQELVRIGCTWRGFQTSLNTNFQICSGRAILLAATLPKLASPATALLRRPSSVIGKSVRCLEITLFASWMPRTNPGCYQRAYQTVAADLTEEGFGTALYNFAEYELDHSASGLPKSTQ